ncbi:hypothetical protein JD844_020435 [Phrynosoma platyrhinos]|uniref:Potassium channel domain-containing protein n=1 Tax=Phrynosoma platyrhinos TaxID=52577 RepID=A0ABQ7SSD2_PHRPL|nr:hypothetical protein JD844_020435 [Phrynosoma platyrhinos]
MLVTTMIHSRLQSCALIAGYLFYLLMGALIFQALEKDAKREQQRTVLRMKEDFLKNITSLSPAEVEVFVENLMEAVRMGIYPVGNGVPNERSNWDFSNSFFFVGSMLSTIGYGNLSPKTAGGQLFCVVFALFGIPLNIKTTRCLTLLFFLVMGILVFLCVPSAIFRKMEGWSYGEAIYFAFITLSTIGFGDYIIGRQQGKDYFPGYRILVAIWIIFGLAWIALLFNLLTTLLEDPEEIPMEEYLQVKTVPRKKRNPKRDASLGFPLEDDLT